MPAEEEDEEIIYSIGSVNTKAKYQSSIVVDTVEELEKHILKFEKDSLTTKK
jgi:hypothetical protein